jgi:purine-binding chemotaxis protein CheW
MFAINVGYAVEVLRARPVKSIPELPDSIDGVIELRGHMFPVVVMRKRLGIPGEREDEKGRVLIVRSPLERVALVVDEVSGVETIDSELIKKPPMVFKGIQKRYLKGLYSIGDSMRIILDMEQILTSEECITFQNVCVSPKEQDA